MRYISNPVLRAVFYAAMLGVVLFVTALASSKAHADTVLGMHLASVHIPAHGEHNFNPGLYVHLDNGITAGAYRNSVGRASLYAGYTADLGPFSLTAGAITGYQRRKVERECSNEERRDEYKYTGCFDYSSGSKSPVIPMLAPSVRLPAMFGTTPRLTFLPGIGRVGSSVLHLSLERSL